MSGNISLGALMKAISTYKEAVNKGGLSGNNFSIDEYLQLMRHLKGIAPEKRRSFEFFKAITIPANTTANIWATSAPIGTVIATHYNIKILDFDGDTDLLKVRFLSDERNIMDVLTQGDFRDHESVSALTEINSIILPAKSLRVECVNSDPTNSVEIFALLKGYYYSPESL